MFKVVEDEEELRAYWKARLLWYRYTGEDSTMPETAYTVVGLDEYVHNWKTRDWAAYILVEE